MEVQFTTTVSAFSIRSAQDEAYEQAKKFYGSDNFVLVGVHGKPRNAYMYEVTFSYEATAEYE